MMEKEFEFGELVYVWDYDVENSVRQFFCHAIPYTICPWVVYSDAGQVSQWRNCSRKNPASAAASVAKNERVIVWNEFVKHRRYSAGKLDADNNLLCYIGGGDSWSSKGETSGWPHWLAVEDDEEEE